MTTVTRDQYLKMIGQKRTRRLPRKMLPTRVIVARPDLVEFVIPVEIKSEMNLREHWRTRNARFKDHKKFVALCWPRNRHNLRYVPKIPVLVTLTWLRPEPQAMDDDNLAGGFKAIRDAIAGWMGVDDGMIPKIKFEYRQAEGAPSDYCGVKIRVEER